MLYTFAQASYKTTELKHHLANIQAQDGIVLWQDGVLLLLDNSHEFAKLANPIYVLEIDIIARGLVDLYSTQILPKNTQIKLINYPELIKITEDFFPQIAL